MSIARSSDLATILSQAALSGDFCLQEIAHNPVGRYDLIACIGRMYESGGPQPPAAHPSLIPGSTASSRCEYISDGTPGRLHTSVSVRADATNARFSVSRRFLKPAPGAEFRRLQRLPSIPACTSREVDSGMLA